jgi:hypothetical protein
VHGEATTDVGTLRLAHGEVRGRLVDAAGAAVADGEVALCGADAQVLPPPVPTGADGAFMARKVDGAPLGAWARRRASDPWQGCTVETRSGLAVVNLGDWPRATVDVLSAAGPSSGCRVELRHPRTFGRGFDAVTALPEVAPGKYAAPAPPGGLLVVCADGCAPYVDDLSSGRRVVLRLPTCSARIAVRTLGGEPAARAKVYARVFSGPQRGEKWALLRPGHVELGETDDGGLLAPGGLWPSTVEVVAFHPRLGVAESILHVVPGGVDHEVVLGASSRGRLVGVLTEERLPPRDRWLVIAERVEPPLCRVTLAEKDGTFGFGALPAGRWELGVAGRVGSAWPTWLGPRVRTTPGRRSLIDPELVTVAAGREVHMGLEIGRWRQRPAHSGRVRIGGAPAPGLAVRLYVAEPPGVAELRRRLAAADARLQTARRPEESRRAMCDVVSLRHLLARNPLADAPAAIALTDESGAFTFDIRPSRLEVVASVDGLEQIVWAGAHESGTGIDVRAGNALVQVRGTDGHGLAHRMFVIEGLGQATGVRFRAVADRFGVLRLPGIPYGSYALRSLTQGGPPIAFPVPAFTIPTRDWVRWTVAAK